MVRSLFLVALSLVAAVTQVVAGATQRDDACLAEMCGFTPTPTTANIVERVDPVGHMSNAERLARGLPLKKPRRRFHAGTPVLKSRDSGIPNQNYRAVIQVVDTSHNVLGYVSKNSYSLAQLVYDPDLSNAAIVDFTLPVGQTTGEDIEFTSENVDSQSAAAPFLGLIEGRDSTSDVMSSGSYNYGYLGSVAHTDAGSDPQPGTNSYTTAHGDNRDIESSVWSIDVVAGTVIPQWINPGGQPATITTFTQSTGLYFGGDEGAFAIRYPAPVTIITFQLILL